MTQSMQKTEVRDHHSGGAGTLEMSEAQPLWQEIGLRLLAEEERPAVAALLVTRGFSRPEAERLIDEAMQQELVAKGLARAHRARKLACLIAAYARQLRQSPIAENVPVEDQISPERFYEHYYFANRPVIVKGWMSGWPALERWTPEYFAERFGDEMLEVSAGREADPRFEDRFPAHRQNMTMRQLVETVKQKAGNDVYLVAKNRLLEREPFAVLRKDYSHPAGILDPEPDASPARMWFGGAGTITPLHHDASNILFGQVYGRKIVRLIPPCEIDNVYNDRHCFSDIDLDHVDYARYPRFRPVTVVQAIVHPGEFLLLPLGWWHQVRALDISISLSFQHFSVHGGPVVWQFPPT